MSLLPDRSRYIALELARPIVEYIEKTLNQPTIHGEFDEDSVRVHCEEFFSAGADKLAKCVMREIIGVLTMPDASEWIHTAPDAYVTLLAANIQVHLICHRDLVERDLAKVAGWRP